MRALGKIAAFLAAALLFSSPALPQAVAAVAPPQAAKANAAAQNAAEAQTVSELDGQDLSALSVAWRRWLTASDDSDPLADDSGDLCGVGQSGAVWFLAGAYSSDKISRRCAIPQGKYIFVPVADIMLWDSADGEDCSLLQADVKTAMDTAHDLFLEIDGRPIDEALLRRAAARQCFTLPNESDIYASDGYWVLLKPLAAGEHILRFGGKLGDDGETAENSAQNIEYRIKVE